MYVDVFLRIFIAIFLVRCNIAEFWMLISRARAGFPLGVNTFPPLNAGLGFLMDVTQNYL